MTATVPQDPAKFRRYRERMKAKGLKQIRMWVLDADAPGVRQALASEVADINARNAKDPWIAAWVDQVWIDLDQAERQGSQDISSQ